MSQYKKSAVFAMACGSVTALLGIIAMVGRQESLSYIAVGATMVINTVLHFESYISGVLCENRRQSNTLAMGVTEAVLLLFFAAGLPTMGWREFVVLFSCYLVFNGASLMVIPSAVARSCGIAAVTLDAAQFLFGRGFGTPAAVLVGANLFLNGAERIVMSALGGKKEK